MHITNRNSTDQGPETPPGPSGSPVVGNLPTFLDDPLGFYTETAREYGPVAGLKLWNREFVQLSDPEYIEQVLVHNNENYVKGEQFKELMEPMIGNGVLLSDGEFWRSQRRTMEPAFHPNRIETYVEVMTEFAQRQLSSWMPGEPRDIYDDVMRITVEIAAKVLFDVDIREREAALGEAIEVVMERIRRRMWRPVHVPSWLPIPSNREYRDALETLDEVAYDIIERNRADEEDADDPVSLLFEADDRVSRKQIRDEVFTLLLAGHETTTLAITYTLQLLASNPETMERLQAELDEVLGDRPPTITDLGDLTYTEQAIKEGMRVYPPVYSMLREATEDQEISGYRIPEGTTVLMQQWVLHRDPTYYDDPEQYRPDRWTDGFEASLPTFAYFPFGGGPRRCIGERFAMLEARLVIATILQSWDLEARVEDIEFAPSVSLRPDGPIEMVPHRR